MEGQGSAKKFKKDNDAETIIATGDIHQGLEDLGKFTCSQVLKDDPTKKMLALRADVKGSVNPAVVIFEKTAFSEGSAKEILSSATALKKTFHNDIYGNYTGFPKPELNGLKVTVIHPATDKHIDKYTAQESILVNETPKLYSEVLLEHLKESSMNIQWVYNILEHRSEAGRIVCEDTAPETGFVLLPDLKWDGRTLETLYLVAIVRRRDLRSLRDLRAEHLPLLRNIWTKGTEAIKEKYGVPAWQLRVYFHYQPSYYHLHVHFTSVRFDAPGTHVGKAHLLPSVISNIELLPDYYQRATLSYFVRCGDPLAARFARAGVGAREADAPPPADGVQKSDSLPEER
ncbi:m7GpppX diphosphatase-like [Pollicipes pollicipes]|uniref:m7GpppX diphosphatase-like n=1 Tax=Pollicipes pollicipes TaxID=41117 RepID=UPI00188531AA|nr:m7GpppX diphosphatase-like [Pollicipes pollicipes]XP_037077428.1 m7GpppX diphosphatase-like [Pollicipes pollicipes]XP_037077429.1 m7GpppX diphosphatase-like [Pollicipes pollicipes]XP_037077430.1 m7GpppX diphosphatase-like [Pollicipes pollicipes]